MNISKETLQIEFVSNRDTLVKIKWGDNSRIVDYYAKKYWYSPDWNKVINDFIEENLYFLLEDENKDLSIDNIKEWFQEINNFEIYEYVDGLIDVYNKDLVESYDFFELYVEKSEIWEDYIEIMRRAQFDWYIELFNNIKNEFALFLENKIDDVK
jgi:hypothetical protein